MKQHTDRLVAGGFVACLLAASILFVSTSKPTFSELENRYLQKLPKLTWERIGSKAFAEDMERYVTDHFPFRDKWVWVKSGIEQLRLQQENNGIFKGKDGYLFERFPKPDMNKLGAYADAVKTFADRHPEASMTLLLAPTSIGLYPERLPWMASTFSQFEVNAAIGKRVGSSLSYMDGFDILRPHASEPIYYRTDHHWTTYGAYLAYRAYAERMGWRPKPEREFDRTTVSDSFLGSFHTKSQFAGLTPDSIQAYVPKSPTDSSMYVADTDETFPGLYEAAYLTKKDQYSYFLGGVHALTKITSKPEPGDAKQRKLLVVKDSYAHNVIPFLALHVPEIHVVDIRYYNGNIGDYMTQNGIRDVLLLFNTATFADNGELLKLAK